MSFEIINLDQASSIDQENYDILTGWISIKEYYQEFELTKNNKISYSQKMAKSSYRDYEHFAGVMGKFNPYTFFYKEPKIVQELDFVILRAVFVKAK